MSQEATCNIYNIFRFDSDKIDSFVKDNNPNADNMSEIDKYIFAINFYKNDLPQDEQELVSNKYFEFVCKLEFSLMGSSYITSNSIKSFIMDIYEGSILLHKQLIPSFFHGSEFYNSLSEDDSMYIPINAIVTSTEVKSLNDYINVFNAFSYWGVEFPNSMFLYASKPENKMKVLDFLYCNACNSSTRELIKELEIDDVSKYVKDHPSFTNEILSCIGIEKLMNETNTMEQFKYKLFEILKSVYHGFNLIANDEVEEYELLPSEMYIVIQTDNEWTFDRDKLEYSKILALFNNKKLNFELAKKNNFSVSAFCCGINHDNHFIIKFEDLQDFVIDDIDNFDISEHRVMFENELENLQGRGTYYGIY